MEIDREDGSILDAASSEEGNIVQELSSTISLKLPPKSPLPASCCIFRVPPVIRRRRVEAYEPDVVSIGPYHHRSRGEKFELMENVKRWYLHCLLSSTDVRLERLVEGVRQFYERARDCYAAPLDPMDPKDFIEMLILDGCFLIELFQKSFCRDLQDEDDPIFNMDFMLDYLYHDLLLLENQLPWFVLEFCFDLIVTKTDPKSTISATLIQLVLRFFEQVDLPIFNPNLDKVDGEVLHILDLIRTVIVVPFEDLESQKKAEPDILLQRIPNATTLVEAGVEFKKRLNTDSLNTDSNCMMTLEFKRRLNTDSNCIMNLEFKKSLNTDSLNTDSNCIMNLEFKKGVLSIPPLGIDERTGPLFRNLIAFEQCHPARLHKITSYAVLMDSLIDSSKDIDLLCEKGILSNWLSSEDAAKFFNDLYNDTVVVGFYYDGLCHEINTHYNKKRNKWMAKLRHDYFSTPWTVISLIAAFILLGLTLLQTVYTIHPF